MKITPKHGLLTFSRISSYKDACVLFIEQLALKIHEISSTIDLPEGKFEDITFISNAFEIDHSKGKEQTLFSISTPNPKQTRLIIAAGVKSETSSIKTKTECYSRPFA